MSFIIDALTCKEHVSVADGQGRANYENIYSGVI